MASTKRKKGPKAMSYEEIGKLPAEEFADALYAKASSEKNPVLVPEIAEAVERYISDTAIARRGALAYLSRPWPEITANIQQDRSTAVAFANVYHSLSGLADRYRDLADYISAAEQRMMLALCTRKDSKAVMQEGKKAARYG